MFAISRRSYRRSANHLDSNFSLQILEASTSDGTSYYNCGAKSWRTLVLLHGAKFTKEDWKTSGILAKLCDNGLAAVALDLSVRATSRILMDTLAQLASSNVISTPIDAIVTPSASGFTMMDGILNGDANAMKKQIKRWIPVATNSALQHSDTDLEASKAFPMLAIYGDQDVAGKKSSYLWKRVAGAKVVELKGGHPVYLDAPQQFVDEIRLFLDVTKDE